MKINVKYETFLKKKKVKRIRNKSKPNLNIMIASLFKFYGLSTFVGYLMPNQFLYKWTVLFHTIQFSTQFNPQNFSISSHSV